MQEPYFLEGSLKMNENNIQEALRILHDTQALVSNSCWRATSLEDPSFLEDMEKIQRAMCNIKGNFMSFIFDINFFIELIDKLTIQNEQLLEKLQDTCFSSYVSDCQMVDCLEDSHDMVDHEDWGNLNVLDVFEYELEEIQTLDVVEEELELSLDEGYAIFKEEHDSSTLEPISYDKGFALFKELHDTTHMDPSHDKTSTLSFV